jgi:hypothetical protein
VQYEQELICSWIVCRGQVRVLPECILKHLSENIWLKVLIIFPLEDLVLGEPLLWFRSLVNTAPDKLLECTKLHRPLGILHWQRTERIELWVLVVAQPLGFRRYLWHHVTIAAGQDQISGGFFFSVGDFERVIPAISENSCW